MNSMENKGATIDTSHNGNLECNNDATTIEISPHGKLRRTLASFYFSAMTCGIEIYIFVPILIPYLRSMGMSKARANALYGFMAGMWFLSSTVSGLIFGKLVDRTRNVRLFLSINIVLAMIGNLILASNYSPYILLVGFAFSGTNGAVGTINNGQVARIQPRGDATRSMWLIDMAMSLGSSSGPVLAAMFTTVDVRVGGSQGFHINRFNAVPLFVAGLHVINLILALTLVHDFEDVDYETIEDDHGDQEKVGSSQANDEQQPLLMSDIPKVRSTLTILKSFAKRIEIVQLFASTIFSAYTAMMFELFIPLIAYSVFGWSIKNTSFAFIAMSLLFLLVWFFSSRLFTTPKTMLGGSMLSMSTTICQAVLIMCMSKIALSDASKIVCMSFYVLFTVLNWLTGHSLNRMILSNMVRADEQSFSQGVSNLFMSVGSILASITLSLAFYHPMVWSIVMTVVTLMMMATFLVYRHRFYD